MSRWYGFEVGMSKAIFVKVAGENLSGWKLWVSKALMIVSPVVWWIWFLMLLSALRKLKIPCRR